MRKNGSWESLRDFIITVFLACSIFEQVAYLTTGIKCTKKKKREKAYRELNIDDNAVNLWEKLYEIYNSVKHIPKKPVGEEPDYGPWYKVNRYEVIRTAYYLVLDLFAKAVNYPKCPEHYKGPWSKSYLFLTLKIIHYQSFFSKTNELLILFRYIVFNALPELQEELEKDAGLT
jgi:hypothetical protein